MNRNGNFSYCQGIDNLEVELKEVQVPEVQKSEQKRILEMIYCRDPETGLPQSDIGMFLSRDTPDTVRDFIERNIFADPSGEKVAPPKDMSDDDIIALTRDRYETREQYVQRINEYMYKQKDEVESAYKKAKLNSKKDK